MRTLLLAITIMTLAVSAPAQISPGFEGTVSVKDGKVSLSVKDAPILTVFDELCKAAGRACSLDPGATELARQLKANVAVENASFEEAIAALAHAIHCYSSVDQGVYVIQYEQKAGEPDTDSILNKYCPDFLRKKYGLSTPGQAQQQGIYLRLDNMSAKAAYDAVIEASGAPDELGWQFEGQYDEACMRGAMFSGIPTRMAAGIVVAAAGLHPPSNSQTVRFVTGTFPTPSPSDKTFENWTPGPGGVSVAAYKDRHDMKWRYFINANTTVPAILQALLPEGVSYVIQGLPASKGSGAVTASVRLTNVALDEALDAILEPTGYTYAMKNGIYIIRHATPPVKATADGAKPPANQKPKPKAK